MYYQNFQEFVDNRINMANETNYVPELGHLAIV